MHRSAIYLLAILMSMVNNLSGQTFIEQFGFEVDDQARGSIELSTGDFMSFGYTKESSTTWPMYVTKVDAAGNLLWDETYAEEGILRWGFDAIATNSDEMIIAGGEFSNATDSLFIHIMKIDSDGTEMWSKTYRNFWRSSVNDIVELPDGNIMGIGSTLPIPSTLFQDLLLVKFDAFGDTLWTKVFPSTGTDSGLSITLNQNGNLIATGGFDNSDTGDYDVWLKEFDFEGNELWSEDYDAGLRDSGSDVVQMSTGDYLILADHHDLPSVRREILLIRTSDSGVFQWSETYGTEEDDDGRALLLDDNDGIYIAGFTDDETFGNEDGFLLHLNSSGDSIWSSSFGYAERDWFNHILKTTDGRLLLTGKTEGELGEQDDYFLVMTDMNGVVSTFEEVNSKFKMYPNPANSFVTLSGSGLNIDDRYDIYDMSGRLVLSSGQLLSNIVDISMLDSGQFLFVLHNESGVRFVQMLNKK